MRVLIVSAFLAVAAAAPSGFYTPILVPAVKTVAIPAAIPTFSPGDLQAAAIDAQVQAQDQAQAAADKARELAEQATENINEKSVTDAAVTNEQNLEAFWSSEDKKRQEEDKKWQAENEKWQAENEKWQADNEKWQVENEKWQAEDKKWQVVDALKTAEAQIDGAVASNANLIAKSAVSGVIPYVTSVGHITPIVAPIPPVVYSSYIAPTSSTQTLISGQEIKTEIKEEKKEEEPAVKSAEPVQVAEPAEAEKAEKAEVAMSPALKAAENLNEKPALITQPLLTAHVGLPNVYRYDLGVPAVGHLIGQPIFKYATAVQHGVLTPTFVKAW